MSATAENTTEPQNHAGEFHSANHASKLNWLRAGVLGANDGVVSVAGLVMGVAGATTDNTAIFIAGVAGLAAGALSMAVGEYVSVSTQRDSEKALLKKEEGELRDMPEHELEELTQIYEGKGLDRDLAEKVAVQLTEKDALRAHAEAELGLDPDELTSPFQAALSSFVAFFVGALVPLIAILVPPPSSRAIVCVIAVAVTLLITGYASARVGYADPKRAMIRNVLGGALAMGITYGIGAMVGQSV